MQPRELQQGQLVQLNPETVEERAFAGCIMVVTEPLPWGARGYVQNVGLRDIPGEISFYSAKWVEMEPVGLAEWMTA